MLEMVWQHASCRRPQRGPERLCHSAHRNFMEKQDLLAYALSNAGTLHCFLRDLWALRGEQLSGGTIFWLNEVPCSTIMFVGIVVGTKTYENNTCIWVDDGSAVVQTKLPHKRVARTVETKDKDGESVAQTETVMEPLCEVPMIGNTVKVDGRLEEAFGREQPVNIRIKEILICGNIDELFHWTRVIELHKTKYLQPFVLPTAAPNIPNPTVSVPSTPQKTRQPESTPKATRLLSTTAPSVSPESVRSYVTEESSCNTINGRMPRLRHPSRLKSSQLNLETFQTHVIYYMTCMVEILEQSNGYCDATPTKRSPFRQPQRRVSTCDSSGEDDELESKDRVGFGLGYLMRVPELQSLAIRVIKAERKLAEKRKILQERENLQRAGSLKLTESSRSKKPVRPGSLKRDTKRLFERVISNLFHNGAIVIEEGRSRRWHHHEAQLVNSSQLWKHKNNETQSQLAESTISTISELSTASIAAEDELQLSDFDEREDAYVPVTPRLLHEPVLFVLKRATRNLRGQQARARGVPESEILEQLKCMDSRWDHVSSITTTLRQLEEEDGIWEVSRSCWVSH